MRTISWKHPAIALIASAIIAACSSDSSPGSADGGDAGSLCGNKKVDKGEDCDGTTSASCMAATMGSKTSGTVSCNPKTCKFDTSKCTTGGTGGSAGAAGTSGTGGSIGTGGGPASKDGGSDASDASATKDGSVDGSMTDAAMDSGKGGSAGSAAGAAGAGGTAGEGGGGAGGA
jgi:hypothetical protein